MEGSFDAHFERGRRALDDRRHADALAAFEAALAVADAPHERALALNGLADINFTKDNDARALDLLDQAVSACLPTPDAGPPADPRTAYALAKTWHDKAMLLELANRFEDALELQNKSLDWFLARVTAEERPDAYGEKLRLVIVRTQAMKCSVLDRLERPNDALTCCNDLIDRFERVQDGAIAKRIARAISHRASLFRDLGRQDREIANYDALFERFGASDDPDVTEVVLYALYKKIRIYQDQDDFDMVIDICDQLIDRYKSRTELMAINEVARSMVRRAVALGKRGEHGKELAGYDAVAALYGAHASPMVRVHAAKALMFKGVSLNEADQGAAEMECYEEVIRRFAEDEDDEVRAVAADAMIYKGMSLAAIAEDAAEDTGERDIEPEIACYDEAIRRYGGEDSIHLQRAVAEALLHKAETLAEAGRRGEASACLETLIASYASSNDQELAETVKEARDLQADL